MTESLFAASRIKLARAEQFIQELEGELEAYKQTDPASARYDFAQNSFVVDFTGIGLRPGAIIGDAVHNLRASLDLMASELARLNGKSDKGVYFPFSDTAENFDDAIKGKNFHKTGADAVGLLRSFAPYRGGNDHLRALHDLDVHDKHTALVPVGSARTVTVEGSYNIDDLESAKIAVVAHDIHYAFPEGGVLAGQNIVETLKTLMQLVDCILEAFARRVELREVAAS